VNAAWQVLLDLATSLDINARDLDNNTPLLVAVQNLRTKVSCGRVQRNFKPISKISKQS
jgi:hypothetical protein